MPTLQDLADKLCEDETDEIEYVALTSQKTSSLEHIIVGNNKTIFTKLKKYSYEFEINENLEIVSKDNEKIENEELEELRATMQERIDELQAEISRLNQEKENLETNITSSSEEYINFRKSIAKSIKDAGGAETSENANTTIFDANIKGIVTEVTKSDTATQNDIMQGKTAHVNGSKITGNKVALTKVTLATNLDSRSSQTVSAKNIPNYQNLTKNNFIIELIGTYFKVGSNTFDDIDVISLNYNSSSGTLTLGTAFHDVPMGGEVVNVYCKYNVYCIY